MAFSLRALGGLTVVLLLSACAATPPPAVSVSPSAAVPAESPSATESASASGSPSAASPSASPSTSTSTPATEAVVLQAKGISGAAFGTPEGEVTALLEKSSGKPDDTYSGPVCELDSATAYGHQLLYGGVAFLFQSKAKGTAKSPRAFTSWVLNLEQPLKPSMQLAPGYPVDTTFAKLRTTFPKGKLAKVSLGESAVYIFKTPAGIWYRGDDKRIPTDMGAGPMGTCE